MIAQKIVETARLENRTMLSEFEAKQVLKEAGIPVIETVLVTSKEEASAISEKLGFPVAMKIASADVVHKSDAGGVKLGLKSANQVQQAYDEILKSVYQAVPNARIDGVSIQKMARQGIEVIIGMSKDALFGPVLMFGLGGILVEVIKDVSFRIVPLEPWDAKEMIREIKGFPLFNGYRNFEPVDITSLEEILLKISDFVEKMPMIKELDLNPILAYNDGAVAVDARIILEETN